MQIYVGDQVGIRTGKNHTTEPLRYLIHRVSYVLKQQPQVEFYLGKICGQFNNEASQIDTYCDD